MSLRAVGYKEAIHDLDVFDPSDERRRRHSEVSETFEIVILID